MKKTLVLIILAVILIAGCGPMTPEQRMGLSSALMNYSQQQQNLANQHNTQAQQNAMYINQQLQQKSNYWQNSPNYWQEKVAEQQWWDNFIVNPR